MKFNSLEAFEKNLRQSAPDHFANIYGIILEDRFERLFYAEKLYVFLKHYFPLLSRQVVRIDAGEGISLSCDLFSFDERFVVVDHVEKLKKGEYQALIEQLETLDPKTKVVLLCESLSQDLYQALKGDLVALDLSHEKPWDKKKRHVSELMKMATRQKKRIEIAAIDLLIDSVGTDLARIKSELDKLFVFTDGKEIIELSDVRQMTLPTKEKSYWQMARDLILGESVERGRIKDISDWLIFSGQVRNQLMNMVRIKEALENHQTPVIEGMRDRELTLLTEKCKERSLEDFLRLLDLLFEFELDAKEEGVRADHLVDRLVIEFSQQVAKI